MRLRTGSWVAALVLAYGSGGLPAEAAPITIYEDVDLSGDYDAGEERTGGANGDGGGTYDYAFDLDAGTQNVSGATLEITFAIWDNNFIILVNGVTVVPLDLNDPAVFTPAIDQPWIPNDNGIPRMRITLDEAMVAFAAAETSGSTAITSGLVYAQPTTNPIFADGQNTLTIVNPDGPGPDALDFTISADVPLLTPEPSTAALIGLGLLGMALRRRR